MYIAYIYHRYVYVYHMYVHHIYEHHIYDIYVIFIGHLLNWIISELTLVWGRRHHRKYMETLERLKRKKCTCGHFRRKVWKFNQNYFQVLILPVPKYQNFKVSKYQSIKISKYQSYSLWIILLSFIWFIFWKYGDLNVDVKLRQS